MFLVFKSPEVPTNNELPTHLKNATEQGNEQLILAKIEEQISSIASKIGNFTDEEIYSQNVLIAFQKIKNDILGRSNENIGLLDLKGVQLQLSEIEVALERPPLPENVIQDTFKSIA